MLCVDSPISSTGQRKRALLEQLKAHPAFRASPLPRHALIKSGFAALDDILGGGFAGGELGALVGPAGCTSLALAILARATARGEVVAWIDPRDTLDPLSISGAGGLPERFLWVRPTGSKVIQRTLQAADLVLDAGGFALVVLDGLQQTLMRTAWWIRLRRRLAGSSTACVVLAPASSAEIDWRLRCQRQARGVDAPLAITVERRRGGAPGSSATITLTHPVD
jgi:hypothetical protein